MFRKISAVAIAATTALCCLAGCSKNKGDETIRLTVKVPVLTMTAFCDPDVDFSKQFIQKAATDFEKDYAAKNNGKKVSLDVIEFAIADETKHISETFDTPSSPDVLYEGYFNMSTYIYTGRVVPLDDIIDEELRADIAGSYWNLSKVNGKTYMLPYLTMQNTFTFNRDIFEAAGLTQYIGEGKDDAVQTWTIGEWENILGALKTYSDEQKQAGKTEIYPIMMYAGSDQGDTHIMTLLRSRGCAFYDEDGYFKINSEEGIAALKWLKDWEKNGYLPSNCDILTIGDCLELFKNGQLAIMMSNAATDEEFRKIGLTLNSVNFPSENGGLATDFVTGFEVFDNGNPEKIEVAKAFVKYIYESDYIDYMAGSIPCSNAVAQRYTQELASIGKYINNTAESWSFTNNSPNWRGVRNVFWQNIKDLFSNPPKSPEEVAAAIDESCNTAIRAGRESGTLHE